MIDFAAMMGASPNSYMVMDRDLRIVWANDAYLRATMRRIEEIQDKPLFDAFPAPDEATERQLWRSIENAFATGAPDEIAFIEYAIRNPDGSMAKSFWSATHTPFRNGAGDIAYVLQHTVNITELETLRRERDAAGVVARARSAEQRSLDLAEEIAKLRNLIEQAPGFMAVSSGPEHRFIFANAAYRRLLGGRELIGKTVLEAVPEVESQGLIRLLDRAYKTGEPYFGQRRKVELVHEALDTPIESYLEFIIQPIRDEQGAVTGIFVQGHDVTEEVAAEERQRLLINELNHRVKNTLAVVQGLAQQSFGGDRDGRFAGFSGRLAALAGAHNLLSASTWEAADLRELVAGSIEAATGDSIARCALSGPAVTLPPQLAMTMAMIAHELATNAIKYGALSNAAGTIEVIWSLADGTGGRTLNLDWRESGGPPVMAPEREGFGARLIRRGLGGQGRTELHYPPAGLHCRIEAKL
jgi:PAS domain S-box-containing protein